MSTKELERLHWMRQVVERRAPQREAADVLGLTVRQVQRWLRDAFELALASSVLGLSANTGQSSWATKLA